MKNRHDLSTLRKQPTDGKKKWVPGGDSPPSPANLEALKEAAISNQSLGDPSNTLRRSSKSSGKEAGKSNQSLGDQLKSVRRNSKSPGRKTGKVQPVFFSPAHSDDNTNDPTENLSIVRSLAPERAPESMPGSWRSNAKHVAFDSFSDQECKPCSKCDRKHYSPHRVPSRILSAEELKIATHNYDLDNAIEFYDEYLFRGNLDGYPVYVSRKESNEMLKFLSEVEILRSLQHPNVITLRAVCEDINRKALVFNFVCSRNLSFHLSQKNFNPVQWPKRANLAIELARGLVYLHDKCSVIHGNINSVNVLVTHDFIPVIGDFSLSRRSTVGSILQDRPTDKPEDKKARGYLAPEYKRRGESSEKQDVYAFGVILIELVSGRAPYDRKREINFLDEWGRTMIEELELDPMGLVAKMLDPRLCKHTEFSSFLETIKVAKQCLQVDPKKRPSMTQNFFQTHLANEHAECLANVISCCSYKRSSTNSNSILSEGCDKPNFGILNSTTADNHDSSSFSLLAGKPKENHVRVVDV